jgi:hypothetical protein
MRVYLGAMRTKTWSSVGVEVVGHRSVTEVVGRQSVAEARWCQSPRFSASLIGLRVRVCGGAVGTVNVGSRAPACLTFIWRCARGGATATKRQAPPIRARLGSGNRSGDRSGEITFLTDYSSAESDEEEDETASPALVQEALVAGFTVDQICQAEAELDTPPAATPKVMC